jgi:ketosteroid isomerase-like protein
VTLDLDADRGSVGAPDRPNDVVIVRQALTLQGRSRRNLEDRLVVRFPRLLSVVSRAVCRLPVRSRLRRAMIRRAVISGWEAANRGDIEVALALYHPDAITVFDPKMVEIGFFEPVYGGLESRIVMQQLGRAEWGEWQFEPEELIFIGSDHLLTVGRMKGTGLTSGANVDTDWSSLFTTHDGRAVREQIFLDRGEAMAAVGLTRVNGRGKGPARRVRGQAVA